MSRLAMAARRYADKHSTVTLTDHTGSPIWTGSAEEDRVRRIRAAREARQRFIEDQTHNLTRRYPVPLVTKLGVGLDYVTVHFDGQVINHPEAGALLDQIEHAVQLVVADVRDRQVPDVENSHCLAPSSVGPDGGSVPLPRLEDGAAASDAARQVVPSRGLPGRVLDGLTAFALSFAAPSWPEAPETAARVGERSPARAAPGRSRRGSTTHPTQSNIGQAR